MSMLLSVSDTLNYLQDLLKADDVLRDIWVAGEVAEFKRHAASGHCYFSLKNENAVLKGVMFKRDAVHLDTLPTVGELVLAHGHLAVYVPRGDLQLYADTIQPAGEGILRAQFEQLKQRLEAEGLFSEARKRPLPDFPRRIGIATSPGGAALQDILNILRRRFPLAEVLLAPCQVQGERAPTTIIAALQMLYNQPVDLIILARGGGSFEDLQAFNDEAVARAVFASPVPLISGVGHETDTTIVDYVADLRAPTPSAAAELATPERDELRDMVRTARLQLDELLEAALADRRALLAAGEATLRLRSPLARLARDRQQIDELSSRAASRVALAGQLRRARLEGLSARLAALNPQATLARGYAIVRRADDHTTLTDAARLAPGDRLAISLRHGTVEARVTTVHTEDDRP